MYGMSSYQNQIPVFQPPAATYTIPSHFRIQTLFQNSVEPSQNPHPAPLAKKQQPEEISLMYSPLIEYLKREFVLQLAENKRLKITGETANKLKYFFVKFTKELKKEQSGKKIKELQISTTPLLHSALILLFPKGNILYSKLVQHVDLKELKKKAEKDYSTIEKMVGTPSALIKENYDLLINEIELIQDLKRLSSSNKIIVSKVSDLISFLNDFIIIQIGEKLTSTFSFKTDELDLSYLITTIINGLDPKKCWHYDHRIQKILKNSFNVRIPVSAVLLLIPVKELYQTLIQHTDFNQLKNIVYFDYQALTVHVARFSDELHPQIVENYHSIMAHIENYIIQELLNPSLRIKREEEYLANKNLYSQVQIPPSAKQATKNFFTNSRKKHQNKIQNFNSPMYTGMQKVEVDAPPPSQAPVLEVENLQVHFLKKLKIYISRLSQQKKKMMESFYLQFIIEIHRYVNDSEWGLRVRKRLKEENGLFCFSDNREDVPIKIFNTIIEGPKFCKTRLSAKGKKFIINYCKRYFNLYGYSRMHDREKRAGFLKAHQTLDPDITDKVMESLLRIKHLEHLHHVKNLFKNGSPDEIPKDRPCFFVYYFNGTQILIPLGASFNEMGLYALHADDNGHAKALVDQFKLTPSRYSDRYMLSESQLAGMKEILEKSEEPPFLLLEEKTVQLEKQAGPKINNRKQPPNKKQRNETAIQHIPYPEPLEIVPRADSLKALPPPIKNSPSISLKAASSHSEPISGSFWKKIALEQCNSIESKSYRPKTTRSPLAPILINASHSLTTLEVKEQPLYVRLAKPYQREGIDRLEALRKISISGILGFWMGLGKTIGCIELFMRTIALGKGKNILALMPSTIISQFMNEAKERISKSIFTTLLASLYNIPEKELGDRLKVICDYIEKALPKELYKGPAHINKERVEAFKEVLILASELPDENRHQLAEKLDLSKILPQIINILEKHIDTIFADCTSAVKQDLLAKISKLPLLMGKQISTDSIKAGMANIVYSVKGAYLLEFMGKLLQIDPHFPYEKMKEENFPGKQMAEFLAIAAFRCDDKHFQLYEFDAPPKNDEGSPTIYFVPYHKVKNAKNSPEKLLEKFANNKIGLVIADEAHFLATNSAKSIEVNSLIKQIRCANPDCWIVPSSGTFIRGELDEVLSLVEKFNPDLIPEQTKQTLIQSFNDALGALQEENKEESFKLIIEAYSQFLILNSIFQKILVSAYPTDPKIIKQWNNRIPEKIYSERPPVSLKDLGIHDEVQKAFAQLNETFKNKESLTQIQRNQVRLLTHRRSHLNQTELDMVIASIKRGESPLEESYFASGLLKNPDFREVIEEGKKAIVYIHHDAAAKILKAYIETYFAGHSPSVQIFNGKILRRGERDNIIANFKKESTQSQILILSIKTGAVGLNFPEVFKTFIVERTFDPGEMMQAEDRIMRVNTIGERMISYLLIGKESLAEQEKNIILKKKTAMTDFFTRPFESHSSHLKLFLNMLELFLAHAVFRMNRQPEEIDKIHSQIQILANLLLERISSKEEQSAIDAINPFASSSTEKTLKRPREEIGEGKDEVESSSSKRQRIDVREPARGYSLSNFLAVPIPNGTKKRAKRAANFILDTLNGIHAKELNSDLNELEHGLKQRSLKEQICSGNTDSLNIKIKGLYKAIEKGINLENQLSRRVQIFEFNTDKQQYYMSNQNAKGSHENAIKLCETTNGTKHTYEVLIPVKSSS